MVFHQLIEELKKKKKANKKEVKMKKIVYIKEALLLYHCFFNKTIVLFLNLEKILKNVILIKKLLCDITICG